MPIYEYQCTACRRFMSALILKPEEEKGLVCRHCRAAELSRVPARFALHKTEAQRVAEFKSSDQNSDSFYRDDRNVGLWAKKRMQQLGVDLGSQFEETVEKARSGKLPDGDLI